MIAFAEWENSSVSNCNPMNYAKVAMGSISCDINDHTGCGERCPVAFTDNSCWPTPISIQLDRVLLYRLPCKRSYHP